MKGLVSFSNRFKYIYGIKNYYLLNYLLKIKKKLKIDCDIP